MARLSRRRRLALFALVAAVAAAGLFALASFIIATRIESQALRVSSSGLATPKAVAVGETTAEVVRYRTPDGAFPAWWIDGERDTALVAVHGRGADLNETLPALVVAADLGHPAMAIRYRNDPGTLISPGRRASFGKDEWRDLEGAVRFALARGAKKVVIVGYSMGGAIALSFMRESPLSSRVSGLILDSPALALGRVIDWRTEQAVPGSAVGLPQALSWGAKRIAGWRYDVDWDAIDFLEQPLTAGVPVLIFHGTDDRTIPIAHSEELAKDYPRLVTLERVEGAGHVESAATDSTRYARSVRALITRSGALTGP